MSASRPAPVHRVADFFVLRAPLLPYDDWLAWTADTSVQGARAGLARILERPVVVRALQSGSASLAGDVEIWRRDPDSKRGRKIEHALVRYVSRMAGRCTPYGMLAGHAVGEWGDSSALELAGPAHDRTHSLLDMDYLRGVCTALLGEPELRRRVPVDPNPTIVRFGDELRYVGHGGKAGRGQGLERVDASETLLQVLGQAAGSTPEALAAQLVDDEITLEDARQFLDELLDEGLLVPRLRPRMTGPSALDELLGQLQTLSPAHEITRALERSRDALGVEDDRPLGDDARTYERALAPLRALPVPGAALAVHLHKATHALRLHPRVATTVLRGVQALRHLFPAGTSDPFVDFRQSFVRRYGDREVPLLEVLDEDHGIGFQPSHAYAADVPWLSGLAFPKTTEPTLTASVRLHEALAAQAGRALSEDRPLELNTPALAALAPATLPPLPDTFTALLTVAAASAEDLDRGRFSILLRAVSGPSGHLLGRFASGDPRLEEHLRRFLAAEDVRTPGTITAEVVHELRGRADNVVARPCLRDAEIPVMGRGGGEHTIPLSQLRVSLRGGVHGRVVLWWPQQGVEVTPRLSCAHNVMHPTNLGVYRFLGAMSLQGVEPYLRWRWGPLAALPRLPRVVCGSVVLARAQWRVPASELEVLRTHPDRHVEWRRQRAIPRHVTLVQDDLELPIDLDNPLATRSLLQLTAREPHVTLTETFPHPDELVISSPQGRYTHELAIPFVRDAPAQPSSPPRPPAPTVPRDFPPGSAWSYLQLFVGKAGADALLTGSIARSVATLRQQGRVDRWHFIRYQDDRGWHLRVRLHHPRDGQLGPTLEVFERHCAVARASGSLRRVALDTYERELERYGGDAGIDDAEALFDADSDAVLGALAALHDEPDGDALRWQLGVRNLHRWLVDVGWSSEHRWAFVRRSRDTLGDELGADTILRRQLGRRFRRDRTVVERCVQPTSSLAPGALARAAVALDQRAVCAVPTLRRLTAHANEGTVHTPMDAMLWSLAHMSTNRLLSAAQRVQEYVLYDLLFRVYDSARARGV